MLKIKTDTVIRNKFHKGFSRRSPRKLWLGEAPVTEIILHGTAGGGTLGWMRNGGRAESYYKGVGLFNYLIEQRGTIWEILPPDRWAYHSCRGRKDRYTISIELENKDRQNRAAYNNDQYRLLFELMFKKLIPDFPTIKVIMGHGRAWSKKTKGRKTKACPGKGFDWERLAEYMRQSGIQFERDPRYESVWGVSIG